MGLVADPHRDDSLLAGRYRLTGLLGRGGMASVYRAEDQLLGREVAVKIFSSGSVDENYRSRQESEMRLLAGFDDPGLVRLFDAGTDTLDPESPRAFMVMELVRGRDLHARIAEGPLSPADTVRIGIALARALDQVHSKGVIHRDIKPANILLTDKWTVNGGVKLADFGVARMMEGNRLTAAGMTIGTANYLSPEQARGLHLSEASDIYSLGLVLLECLKGRVEYPGTPLESAAARLHRAPAIPATLTPLFRELLAAMTDPHPEKRPSAATVAQALSTLPDQPQNQAPTILLPPLPEKSPFMAATAEMTSVRPVGGTAATGISRRRRLLIVLALAAGAAVAVPLVALVVQGPHSGTTPPTQTPANGTTGPAQSPGVPTPVQTIMVPGPVQTIVVPGQDRRKQSNSPGDEKAEGNDD